MFGDWGIRPLNYGLGVCICENWVLIQHEGLEECLQVHRAYQGPSQSLVFEGRAPGQPMSSRSVQWIFIRARRKAGLPEWVTAHVLRHSYATVNLKNGMDVVGLGTVNK